MAARKTAEKLKPQKKTTSTKAKAPKRPTKAQLARATDDAIRKEYEARFLAEDTVKENEPEDGIEDSPTSPSDDLPPHIDVPALDEEVTVPQFKTDPDVVLGIKAPSQASPEFANSTQPVPTTSYCARNLTGSQLGYRLTRQTDANRRTNLKPRGQRGDIAPLLPQDLQDVELENQVQRGLIEIITAAEAKSVIEKQVTNAQQTVHPAMAMLRNELGQAGPDGEGMTVSVDNPEDRAVVVAQLNPTSESTGDVVVASGQGGGIQRELPQQAPRAIGGNPHIISDGFNPQAADMAKDAIARRKGIQGPKAGGITAVTVEAPVKS